MFPMTVFDLVATGSLSALLALAVVCDLRSRRIPNALVLGGTAAGVTLGMLSRGLPGAMNSLEGAAVGLAVLLPFYLLRTLGAGDVKLMAAVGAFLGPDRMFGAVICTFLAGGLIALTLAASTGTVGRLLGNLRTIFIGGIADAYGGRLPTAGRIGASVGELPYAVAIALGVLAWLAWTQIQGAAR